MNRRGKVSLVFCCFAICGAAAVVRSGLEFPRQPARPAELYEVVWQQISAFRTADYSRAYQQVSTTFQERFDIQAFAELVRTDYPDLLRAQHVEFGGAQIAGHHALIQVYFVLGDGDVVPVLYGLVNEEHRWKIDGVRVDKRWPIGRRLGGMRG
ncbi:MAG: hypothetical protein JWL90_3543 [Chthoniobacteraceae bacterium]|nr:hypothetical protein [Chthoniobacteraceae bacterium]